MKSEESPLILLDTHVFVWLEFGERDRLTNRLWGALERAGAENKLLVSVFSIWEIGMLEAKGRLKLFAPCAEWVRRALSTRGLTLAPLTPEIAVDSTHLPGNFHGDPADRIIVSTARLMDARLLTRDGRMLEYARQGYIRVV